MDADAFNCDPIKNCMGCCLCARNVCRDENALHMALVDQLVRAFNAVQRHFGITHAHPQILGPGLVLGSCFGFSARQLSWDYKGAALPEALRCDGEDNNTSDNAIDP